MKRRAFFKGAVTLGGLSDLLKFLPSVAEAKPRPIRENGLLGPIGCPGVESQAGVGYTEILIVRLCGYTDGLFYGNPLTLMEMKILVKEERPSSNEIVWNRVEDTNFVYVASSETKLVSLRCYAPRKIKELLGEVDKEIQLNTTAFPVSLREGDRFTMTFGKYLVKFDI